MDEDDLIKKNKDIHDKDSGKAKNTSKKSFAKMQSTLIVFTASWAENCYFTYPIWVSFANRFTTNKVRIVEIDCGGTFSRLARQFKINTMGVAN
jgi:hypothetical protein